MKKRWDELLGRIQNNYVGAEVGVWMGDNAYNLLKTNDSLWLCCVDQWLAGDLEYVASNDGKSKIAQRGFDDAYQTTVNRLKEFESRHMILRMSSLSAANVFKSKYFDFVFIDGNHSYKHVKQDILAWLPKIKKGGFISGHDFGVYPGVAKAVREIFDNVVTGEDYTWFVTI